MKQTLALAAAVLLAATAVAEDKSYTIKAEASKVEFTGTKTDGKHDGGFKDVAGTVTCGGDDLTAAKFDVSIATESIFSDNDKLTAHLKSPDFFAIKDNPKITFVSTKVEKSDAGYSITGDLTMLGKTKSVTIPAEITKADKGVTVKSAFKVNRTDWGMTYGQGKINDDVELRLNLSAE